jgi:hypothetical protein
MDGREMELCILVKVVLGSRCMARVYNDKLLKSHHYEVLQRWLTNSPKW